MASTEPMPAPRVCDTTLRDGSHAMAHQFTPEQVRSIVSGLVEAGVPVIEVSHGDGLGGSSFQYGFSKVPEEQLLAAAADVIRDKKLAVLRSGVSLQQLVNGLNALGVGPRDMIAILQAIKAAGALQAEIEVM